MTGLVAVVEPLRYGSRIPVVWLTYIRRPTGQRAIIVIALTFMHALSMSAIVFTSCVPVVHAWLPDSEIE